ncbi:protein of unknown function DUF1816 [Halothece sp. PCC 7418]|uniref:DUF1816 domain-containing protein n=1 Tax=Halothece sp. (strain PCC 7418) TaxID=65093 RepID=UPI0002A06043|nr:DUF1816 domain-containing protein [Halothece sp. PCC 7418]AFZ45684.1 protein of unknown function DUF1816 [Halothece sp. PCC 7418]
MEEFILSILDFLGQAWWVEIKTESPKCTYYFGPFVRKREAEAEKSGYIEDLQGEGAKIVSLEVKRCKPTILTDDQETEEAEDDDATGERFPSLSGHGFKSFHE